MSKPISPAQLQAFRDATGCEKHLNAATHSDCDACLTLALAAAQEAVPSAQPESCPMCGKSEVERTTDPADVQWGGAREGEIPFRTTISDERSRCKSCGEQWYTPEQSRVHDRLMRRALYADWQRLVKQEAVLPSPSRLFGALQGAVDVIETIPQEDGWLLLADLRNLAAIYANRSVKEAALPSPSLSKEDA